MLSRNSSARCWETLPQELRDYVLDEVGKTPYTSSPPVQTESGWTYEKYFAHSSALRWRLTCKYNASRLRWVVCSFNPDLARRAEGLGTTINKSLNTHPLYDGSKFTTVKFSHYFHCMYMFYKELSRLKQKKEFYRTLEEAEQTEEAKQNATHHKDMFYASCQNINRMNLRIIQIWKQEENNMSKEHWKKLKRLMYQIQYNQPGYTAYAKGSPVETPNPN